MSDIDDFINEHNLHSKRKKQSKLTEYNSGLTNLQAAAKKHPEVMVKIPKRLSKNSKGLNGVRNHLSYVSRNGEVPLETNLGEKLHGNSEVRALLDDWRKLNVPDESKHREALNIVLSMPKGTPPEAVLARKTTPKRSGEKTLGGNWQSCHDDRHTQRTKKTKNRTQKPKRNRHFRLNLVVKSHNRAAFRQPKPPNAAPPARSIFVFQEKFNF